MAFAFRAGTNWCHDFPKLARESGFYFSVHRSRVRVDWNRIININIDQVIKDRDFSVVDENVNNVINYCLESEYDIKILDPNFVKLFRLAQLAVEYLLYCKQYLDHSVVILKDELKQKIEENVKLKKETATLEEIIKQLKEKPKEKGRFLEAKIGDCNGEIYKCPHCPKTFISTMFLNAHVTRRHAYISGMCFTSSPIHEHYHTETEKLHNEIKSLKERLNEAEKVIKKESDRTCSKTNVEGRLSGNEIETSQHDSNKFGGYQDHKGYLDEISTLKSMLFEEIRNLRQKDRMMYEYSPETNVQTLISQQEKEFQKLTNQLLEKLTPDIENMNTKLHAQEDYWRTKIENMEYCHQKDIERLSTELKLTQKTADQIKLEYESKVTNLERHSMNQSNILQEQSQQLHSLSGAINHSPNDEWENPKKNLPESQPAMLQQCNNENDKEKTENDSKQRYRSNGKASQLIVADIDSASSYDSTGKLVSSISQNKLLPKSVNTSKSPSETITSKSNERTKRKPEYPRNSSKTFESINNVERSLKNYDSTDLSESQDLMQDKQINNAVTRKGYDLKDRLSMTNSYFEETRRKQPESNIANHVRMLPGDENCSTKKTEILEEGVTSETETKSESVSLDSQSESESESLARNNLPLCERKTISVALPKPRSVTRHSTPYKTLEMELQEMFDKRLKDLGIDPEWQGIPKATFKQKMDILRHHQKITAKKFPKYHQVKLRLIEEVLSKISKKGKQMENVKSIKKSPLNKLVKNVKSKTLKVFSNQKIPDKDASLPKLQDTTTKRIHSKLETSNDHAKNEIVNSSLILSSNTNIPHSYDFAKSTAMQSTPISNYENLGNQIKFFPNVTKSQEILKHSTYSHDFARTNGRDSPNKTKHLFDAVQNKPPSNSKQTHTTKSSTNNDLHDTNMPQELYNISMSPKSNKSVLKSTTGSTSSLVKKKVLFDLSNDNYGGESLPEHNTKIEDANDNNWNVSSVLSEQEHPFEKDDHKTTSNIILKTSQSDKIAAISRKLEAQLSMVRQKPVGSVETLFASKYVQEQDLNNDEDQQVSSDSINSLLETPRQAAMVSHKMPKDLFPHPAPRNLKGKMSASEVSDLDSDIDRILKLE